jgi:hypothetical protein
MEADQFSNSWCREREKRLDLIKLDKKTHKHSLAKQGVRSLEELK